MTKHIADDQLDILGPDDHAVIRDERDTNLIGGLDKFAALAGMMALFHPGGAMLVPPRPMREPETPLLASSYKYSTRHESPARKAARLAIQEAQKRKLDKQAKKRSKRKAQSQARKASRHSR